VNTTKIDSFDTNIIWQKIAAIFCFIILAVSLFAAYINPAKGYEIDIYYSTPIIVWVAIILGFFLGAIIIILQLTTDRYLKSNMWLIGLAIIIVSRMVLLFTPYIRGYVSWSGDNIAYLGMIKDIMQTGHFTSANYYPFTHAVLSSIINVTQISDSTIANLSTTGISILFILFTYLFIEVTTHDKKKQILATIIAGAVMLTAGYNVILAPNGWSILFMPLLFYLYFRYSELSYRILLIILLVIYPIFHPLSALIVIIALFIFESVKCITRLRMKTDKNGIELPSFLMSFLVLEFILYGIWILSHHQFNENLILAWNQITFGLGSGKVSELADSLNKIDVHGLGFYLLLLKLFGADIILILVSVTGMIWLLKRYRNTVQESPYLFPLACLFFVCGIIYAGYLLGLPGTQALGTGQWDRRILGYVDIIIPVFSVIIIDRILFAKRSQYIAYFTVICIIFFSSALSVASLYQSSYINQPNNQVTRMDLAGVGWFIKAKDNKVESANIASTPSNLENGVIGYQQVRELNPYTDYQLEDHFGYSKYDSLGPQYSTDKYVMVTEYDRIIYSRIWRQIGRFNTSDFNQLDQDTSVDLLYSNGETQLYYINGKLTPTTD
jgi:hypothetical protein